MENLTITFDTLTPLSSSNSTPRISFSYDPLHSHKIPSSSPPTHSPSSTFSDFDFQSKAEASSYADDLFSGGVILPLPLTHSTNTTTYHLFTFPPISSTTTPQLTSLPTTPQTGSTTKDEGLRRASKSCNEEDKSSEARRGSGNHKTFWPFRRCSSLNFGSGGVGLCSLSLLRSKSTGSSPTSTPARRDRNGLRSCDSLSPSSKASKDGNARRYYYSGGFQRSEGVRVGPVLNFPAPCSMNLFSFLLCNCGYKN